MDDPHGSRCEYCDGVVGLKGIEREAFKHKRGFVILEDVVIGVCDHCGSRCNSTDTLHRVHEVAVGEIAAARLETVPVAAGS